MTKAERVAYYDELRKVARRLHLPLSGNLEEAIIRYYKRQLAAWVAAHAQPTTLTELLDLVGTSLGLGFAEIYGEADLDELLRQIPPGKEPLMARVQAELDDQTDAVTIRRDHREAWEQPFLAVINCQGWHSFRRYFSKWHEAVHRLLEGQQLQFAFRRTPVQALRSEPQEVLVDRIAAALAFYPDIFEPVFFEELGKAGRLTFDVADETRRRVAPDASRQATVLACIRSCFYPVWFIRCAMGYKKDDERRLRSPQMRLLPDERAQPESKLRVQEAAGSPSAIELGVRIHQNMQVPDSSVVAEAFHDPWGLSRAGSDSLEDWETSSGGPIGFGKVEVEAFRTNDQVWALLYVNCAVTEPGWGKQAIVESS